MQFRADPELLLKEFNSENKSFVLGARIKGPLSHLFLKITSKTLGIDKNNHLSKGKNSNVIVFSDTDLLSDITWLTKQEMFGTSNIIPTADNGRLVINAIESMSGGKNLIGLRSRGGNKPTFLSSRKLTKKCRAFIKRKRRFTQK